MAGRPNSRTKRTSPLQLPKSLIHGGLGRFAAPSTIAKQYFASCASVHLCFYLVGKSWTLTLYSNTVFPSKGTKWASPLQLPEPLTHEGN